MSGFSKNEMKNLIKSAIEPNVRKLLCAIKQQPAITVESHCDNTSGDVVAYVVITYNPVTDTMTTSFFDAAYAPIESLPANSAPCGDD